jgi:hypothetical protein
MKRINKRRKITEPIVLKRRTSIRRGKPNKYMPHSGDQECSRRRRQIQNGQLKIENGLQ